MDSNIGLVLEGGGMRGVFTSGVLDCFLDFGLSFSYVIGVSAGGSNGLSYASGQRGRARKCNIDVLRDRPYINLRYMFSQGCIMDYDFLFGDLPLRELPYNFSEYKKFINRGKYTLVATNCLTGAPEYFGSAKSEKDLLMKCRASCSMPFVSTITHIDNIPYLDGGISDPIPIRKAQSDGCAKNVVVLTRNRGYRKRGGYFLLPYLFYPKYPNLRKTLSRKSKIYNEELQYAEECEENGSAILIRPLTPLHVGRFGRDIGSLESLYEEGYSCAKAKLAEIENF